MPPQHKWQNDWSAEKIINWADKKGKSVRDVIEIILNLKQHPEQGYKVCLGILKLADSYGDKRLKNACSRALYFRHYSYKGIKNILNNNLDSLQEDSEVSEKILPQHENIRGNEYYNEEVTQ